VREREECTKERGRKGDRERKESERHRERMRDGEHIRQNRIKLHIFMLS